MNDCPRRGEVGLKSLKTWSRGLWIALPINASKHYCALVLIHINEFQFNHGYPRVKMMYLILDIILYSCGAL